MPNNLIRTFRASARIQHSAFCIQHSISSFGRRNGNAARSALMQRTKVLMQNAARYRANEKVL